MELITPQVNEKIPNEPSLKLWQVQARLIMELVSPHINKKIPNEPNLNYGKYKLFRARLIMELFSPARLNYGSHQVKIITLSVSF